MCVIRYSKTSIQRISTTILVFTYFMDSINNHKFKWISRHSECTSYMEIISSTIYLGQMKTAVTITSRHYFPAKTTWSKTNLKWNSKLEGAASSFVDGIDIPLIWMLGVAFYIYEITIHYKFHLAKKIWRTKKKVMNYRSS